MFKDCAQLITAAYVHGLPNPVEIGEFGLQLDHSNIQCLSDVHSLPKPVEIG